MPEELRTRVDIGFDGGQTLVLKVTAAEHTELVKRVEKGDGWHSVRGEDGEYAVNTGKVVYVRRELDEQRVGF